MLDIFDEAIIEKGEKIFKIVVIAIGLVLAVIGVSGDVVEKFEILQQTQSHFEEGVTMMEEGGISVSDIKTEMQGTSNSYSKEQIVYECLVAIANEKGYKDVKIQTLQSVLSDDEKLEIYNISKDTHLSNVDIEKLHSDKQYRTELFGFEYSTTLYNIVNSHKNDFK